MFRFETIRAPARTLSPRQQGMLRDQILALNLLLSPHEQFRRNWRARIDALLVDTDLLDLAYAGGALVGHYSSRELTVAGRRITYIDTYTVHPGLQRSRLGARLAARMAWHGLLRARGIGFILASRTGTPREAASVWDALGPDNYYPSFSPETPHDPQLAAVAEALATRAWPRHHFSIETGVLEGAYGGRVGTPARSRHALVQSYFDRNLDPRRGDALVQVVCYRRSAWLRFARRSSRRLLRMALGTRSSAASAPGLG